MLSFLFSFLKKIWNKLKKVIAIALIALAVYFTLGGALTISAFTIGSFSFSALTLTGTSAALLAGGAAFLVDSDTTSEVVEKVAEGIGKGATAVLSGVTKGVTGFGFGNLLLIAGGGFIAYKLLSDSSEEPVSERTINYSSEKEINSNLNRGESIYV